MANLEISSLILHSIHTPKEKSNYNNLFLKLEQVLWIAFLPSFKLKVFDPIGSLVTPSDNFK